MPRVSLLVVLSIGLLFSAATIADDEVVARAPAVLAGYLAVTREPTYSDIWLSQMDTLEFQDNSPLARISRIRELPLLTLAETPRSRLYLGVNGDGVFGLHFRAR